MRFDSYMNEKKRRKSSKTFIKYSFSPGRFTSFASFDLNAEPQHAISNHLLDINWTADGFSFYKTDAWHNLWIIFEEIVWLFEPFGLYLFSVKSIDELARDIN